MPGTRYWPVSLSSWNVHLNGGDSECVHEVSVGWSQTAMSLMTGRKADMTRGRGGWLRTEDMGGLLRRGHLSCLVLRRRQLTAGIQGRSFLKLGPDLGQAWGMWGCSSDGPGSWPAGSVCRDRV